MIITLLKISATITLFHVLEFSSFFILLGAISCVQIYFIFFDNKQFGFDLIFKIFYIIIALAIIANCEIEVLSASGLLIVVLACIFYFLTFINNKFFHTKIFFTKQKYNLLMICITIICTSIAIITRHRPTQMWLAPLILAFCVIIKEFIPDKFFNSLVYT